MKKTIRPVLSFVALLITFPVMGQRTVIVGVGETFETIANKHGISLAELQAANPEKTVCYTGMELMVPAPEKSPVGSADVTSVCLLRADGLLLEAKRRSLSGEYSKAIKLYNEVIGMNVRVPYAYAGRGECYFGLKKYKKAKKDLLAAINCNQLAKIERDWCEEALADVENELEARRQRRSEIWENIGLTVASAAAFTASAYVASEQSKMQNRAYQQTLPTTYSGASTSRADQVIAQSNAQINQMMTQANAQLNQMTSQMMAQAEQAKERMHQAFKEEWAWRGEFAQKNGREPTEYEVDQWYGTYYPDLLQSRIMARANTNSGDTESDATENDYQGELSPDQYLAHYRKWEQYAEDAVRNLTSGGYSTKDNSGNIKGKANSNYVKGIGYTGNQMNLHECQREMRRIRLEAAKYGVNIPQSKWETATVSY